MIYLFSSSFYDLFRQNVLNACCYPHGYIMRLRYSGEYLSSELKKGDAWKKLPEQTAIFVFAEGALQNKSATTKCDYRFMPIRRCTVQSVQMTAGIFILDVKLGPFLDYGAKSDRTRNDAWDTEIKAHPDRPYPKDFQAAEGSYVYRASALSAPPGDAPDEMAWRSIVDRLNQSE